MRLRSRSPEESRALARALGAVLADSGRGAVLGLIGPLGAGKTEFVKGLAEGLGVDPALVASPTFVIASAYPGGRLELAHVDLYRIESEDELLATGFLDLLAPDAVVAVEWADRFPEALPADRVEIRIARPDADTRELTVHGHGPEAKAVVESWSTSWARAC